MRKIFLIVLVVLLGIVAFSSSTVYSDMTVGSKALSGQVTDIDTGEPVPGAYVIVTWFGEFSGWPSSGTNCVRGTSVRANHEGRFIVPEWESKRPALDNLYAQVLPYKPGYERVKPGAVGATPLLTVPGILWIGGIRVPATAFKLQMKKIADSPDERAGYIRHLLITTACADRNSPAYSAIREEARHLPQRQPGQPTDLMTLEEMVGVRNPGSDGAARDMLQQGEDSK